MRLSRTAIQVCPRRARFSCPAGVRAAVSLHSHSECSREKLDELPDFARRIPILAGFLERSLAEYERENGEPLDLSAVYWRPPLAPSAVIRSEREQIEHRLDSKALVSLTDHDTLDGPKSLRMLGMRDVPLSVEWSVPFNGTVFHLGVHGISPKRLEEMECELAAYTAGTTDALGDLLDALCECPETFIVLNHPYWDFARIGQLQHDSMLLAFLRSHRDRIHALELNGYRTWTENRRVLPLAEGFGLPVVGGGDRHGYTPNTVVNLTRATCLAEFARELRCERVAHCVVFPEFAEPYVARVLQTAGDILRSDPRNGRRRWTERVFIKMSGVEQAVDSLWDRPPRWLSGVVAVTLLLSSRPFGPLLELTRSDGHKTLEVDCRPETVFERVPTLSTRGSAAVV
jgi:hypothetical protein